MGELLEEKLQLAGKHILYHYTSCPFCFIVRRVITSLELPIQMRNIHQESQYLDELIAGGGKRSVPCLRIENADGSLQWMYESADINRYLQNTFGDS